MRLPVCVSVTVFFLIFPTLFLFVFGIVINDTIIWALALSLCLVCILVFTCLFLSYFDGKMNFEEETCRCSNCFETTTYKGKDSDEPLRSFFRFLFCQNSQPKNDRSVSSDFVSFLCAPICKRQKVKKEDPKTTTKTNQQNPMPTAQPEAPKVGWRF